MTNQDKTNLNKGNAQGGQAANQGKQGDPSDWNTQKTGQTGKGNPQGGQGVNKGAPGTPGQMGGKNPPSGGPDQYKPNQPMEGDQATAKGGQSGIAGQKGGQAIGNQKGGSQQGTARDPYPPTNPDRPVMAGGKGDVEGGSFKGQAGGEFGGAKGVGDESIGGEGNLAKSGGLEEEE